MLNLQNGVPQGSILGPLIFLIYINDIINVSKKFSFILFADDTNALYSHHDLEYIINTVNNELPKLIEWFTTNKLSLNLSKTNYIVFRNQQKVIDDSICKFYFDNHILERKTTTKFLGIDIDQHLTWNNHYDIITSSIARTVGILYKLRQFVPRSILHLLYNSLILSRLLYCNVAWGRSSKRNIESVLLLQKKAIRICTGSQYLANTDPLFNKMKLLKINDITYMQTAMFMFKLSIGEIPPYFFSIFQKNRDIHFYNTRSSDKFHLTNPKIILAQRSIRHTGPDVWHTIPEEIKHRTLISSFKAALKRHFLSS